jgi:hypothetical protein
VFYAKPVKAKEACHRVANKHLATLKDFRCFRGRCEALIGNIEVCILRGAQKNPPLSWKMNGVD